MQKARQKDSRQCQMDTNSSKTIRGSVWCKWINHVASLTATQRRELYLSLPKLFGTDKSLRQKRTNLEKLLQEKVFNLSTTTEHSSPIGHPSKAARRILHFVMRTPQSDITELLRSLQNDNESTSATECETSGCSTSSSKAHTANNPTSDKADVNVFNGVSNLPVCWDSVLEPGVGISCKYSM